MTTAIGSRGDSIPGADVLHRAAATLLLLITSACASSDVKVGRIPESVPGEPSEAIFEQGQLDLGQSWGNATACVELGDHTECFRTERELLAAHSEFDASGAAATNGVTRPTSRCSTSLRLYRSTGFTGGTLVLTTRAVVLNLSTYGFDNDTSSYRVGACASTFWASASGSGSVYAGPTAANASASSMLCGWNNAVSSVYIS